MIIAKTQLRSILIVFEKLGPSDYIVEQRDSLDNTIFASQIKDFDEATKEFINLIEKNIW